MNLKRAIYDCLNENMAQIRKRREEDLYQWRIWSRYKNREIVVFGSSAMCEICLRYLEELDIHVDVICDNDSKRFGEFVTENGRKIPIVSVEEAMSGTKEKLCLVAAGTQHFPSISKQLEQYRITETVFKWQLDFYLETILLLCVRTTPFMDRVKQILSFYDDNESLKLLWAHFSLLFDLNNVPEELGSISMEQISVKPHYFLKDGKYLGKQEIMIDCGAYTGDTLEDLIYQAKYYDFDQYDCYELFPATYEKLINTIQELPIAIKNKIRSYNLGVWDRNSVMKAVSSPSSAGNSSFSNNGDTEVRMICLDDVYVDKKITFIKMDIEGSEQAALRGAKNIIMNCRPMCAICIYHTVSSFWEIPQILKEYVPEYEMILRHHTPNWDDTVCYAKIGAW